MSAKWRPFRPVENDTQVTMKSAYSMWLRYAENWYTL